MKHLLMAILGFMPLAMTPTYVQAHPGRTASDGCHYCRTNCDYWGVPAGQRHCHFYQEPTPDLLEVSKVVKEYSDEDISFITILKDNVWSTYEIKEGNHVAHTH